METDNNQQIIFTFCDDNKTTVIITQCHIGVNFRLAASLQTQNDKHSK